MKAPTLATEQDILQKIEEMRAKVDSKILTGEGNDPRLKH